jgi:hypothetical protein
MRRKKLISPEKPVQDLVEYRFKIMLLPFISISVAIFILAVFIVDFIELTTGNIAKIATFDLMHWSSYILLLYPISLALLVKISDNIFVFTSDEISGFSLWLRRTCIKWDRIATVKSYQVMGLRYLSIKALDGKNIHLATRLYKTSQILDLVRELAGEDHILVRALEKELSRPRYELTRLWCGVIGSIALTMSIYIIGGNMYAAEQEKPIEQAIASYVRQHPKTPPNQSAIELQALMTKLGLSVEAFGDGSEVKVKPEKTAISEWKAIELTFTKYLDKQLETKELIEPFSDELANYLKKHKADIAAIETHLIENSIPQWGSDLGWIEKSDPKAGDSPHITKFINGFNLWYIENLMMLNVLDQHSLPNADISRDLAAIEKIQQSFQSEPSLFLQLISRIGERRISDLVRRVDIIPIEWGNNLFNIDRHSSMYSAVINYSININRILQSEGTFRQILIDENSPLRFIPEYYKLARPHIRLGVVARHQEVVKGLDYWSKQNICRTNGQSGLVPVSISGVDNYDTSTPYLASQYPKVLKSDLRWEATSAIRQVKAKLIAGEKVDRVAKDFNIQSQVCPGEQWTAKATDRAVNISFSHPPDWKALGVNNPVDIDPLTYTIKPIE